jgi:hypothetical protein
MTTTAASTNTSASTSTPPKDSPGLHDYDDDDDDDVDVASKSIVEQQKHEQHNHIEQKCQSNSDESPSPQQQQPPPPPPSQNRPHSPPKPQSIDIDVSNTSTTNANSAVQPTQTTISSNPAANVKDSQSDQQLEQSTSSQQQLQQSTTNNSSNSNNNTEQKRPMNAFLLFCKRQRSLVKEKYPNLENRGVTKILGDWWSKLDKEQKSKYTDLARQHKEAFMKANPDFKWCKTPNVSNLNNNISANDIDNESCNNSNAHQHQQQPSQNLQRLQQNNRHPPTATNAELLSLQSIHHPMDVVHHSSNSMDIMLKSRQQLEAPKPPKKRFLERNDSVYTSKNIYGPNHNDTNSHGADVVPYISLDQDFLDRVIDKAFSEDSSGSPSGVNSCKCSNRNSTNLTSSSNPTSFSSSSTSNYTTSIDEPVDFSMNRTINATSQQIINNLVEKMLSEGPDNGSSFSKMNGTDSVRSQLRPPVKRDNLDDT